MVSEHDNDTASNDSFAHSNQAFIIFFKALTLFILDWWGFGFAPTPLRFTVMTPLYIYLYTYAYFQIKPVLGSQSAMKRCLWYFFVSFLGPMLIPFIIDLLSNALINLGAIGGAVVDHIKNWAVLTILYFAGGLAFWVSVVSQKRPVFGFINYFLIGTIFVWAVMTFFIPSMMALGIVDTQAEEVPHPSELFFALTGHWIDLIRGAYTTHVGGVNETIRNAVPAAYSGQVERQQGKELGVVVTDLTPLLNAYEYEVTGTGDNVSVSLVRENDHVQWYGTLRARTFTSQVPVHLRCVYELPLSRDDSIVVNGTARPSDLVVRYTGEFMDFFDFDCTIPMAQLPYNTSGFTSGRFLVKNNFTFETWGYTTYTFMDADEITALRRQNIDPAHQLGIRPRSQPIYTPGPVSLGMPVVSLPVGVRYSSQSVPEVNLPPMGVTLENAWVGRGFVTDVEYVVMQVPVEFSLLVSDGACLGTSSDPEIIRSGQPFPYEVSDPDSPGELEQINVPEGYNWYLFTNMSVPRLGEQVTVRCPMGLSGEGSLLNPDLSPRQFTFVTQAKYGFETENNVNVNLRVVRVQ